MTELNYFWCILFIIAGIYFIITEWNSKICNGILKRNVDHSGPFGHRIHVVGCRAFLYGIFSLLTFLSFIIIPLYFIIKDLLK